MFKPVRSLLLALLLLAMALPAAAAERVAEIPEIKSATRARFDLAYVLNNQPFIVGKGEVVGPDRAHFVLRTVPMPDLPEATVEVVMFDGRTYVREDASAQWYVEHDLDLPVSAPAFNPEIDISLLQATSIGTKTIAGTPTNQYQIWLGADNGSMDHIALDFFIGQQINYMRKTELLG